MRCGEIEDRRPLVNEGPLENDGLENEDPRENEDFENEDCTYILQFFGSLWNSHGAAQPQIKIKRSNQRPSRRS